MAKSGGCCTGSGDLHGVLQGPARTSVGTVAGVASDTTQCGGGPEPELRGIIFLPTLDLRVSSKMHWPHSRNPYGSALNVLCV